MNHFIVSRDYPVSLFQAWNSFTGSLKSVRLEHKKYQNFENFKFYPNITKTGVTKNIDHNPINSRNYAAFYYQTLKEVPAPLLPEKIQKHEKIANIL